MLIKCSNDLNCLIDSSVKHVYAEHRRLHESTKAWVRQRMRTRSYIEREYLNDYIMKTLFSNKNNKFLFEVANTFYYFFSVLRKLVQNKESDIVV